MRATILLATLALASCEPGQGVDGYRFGERRTDHVTVNVTRVEHPTIDDLRRAARAAGAEVRGQRDVFAFATISEERGTCTIHFVRPESSWHPEALGHELAHCFYGAGWHS